MTDARTEEIKKLKDALKRIGATTGERTTYEIACAALGRDGRRKMRGVSRRVIII